MRVFWIVAIAFSLHAGSAGALVSVDHQDDTGGAVLAVGDTFNVDIIASYDGSPSVAGLFTSSAWNPTELLLIGVTDAPMLIFPGPSGFLLRVSNPFVHLAEPAGTFHSADPAGTIRSVQYGAFPGLLPSAGPATLITTLTFQVLSGGDGIGEIDTIFNLGDQVFASGSACGSPIVFCGIDPADVSLGGTTVTLSLPEPGSALLLGLGLMGLGASRSRRDPASRAGENGPELLADDLV